MGREKQSQDEPSKPNMRESHFSNPEVAIYGAYFFKRMTDMQG
jgi:hypothetical protein